jgi:hypothetical protein
VRLCIEYPFRRGRDLILLDFTPCTYGGQRPWFLCPKDCGQRVARLYWTENGLGCRHCAGLSYRSQSEAEYDRALRRAWNAYGQTASLSWWLRYPRVDQFPDKPKGMHWSTYGKLKTQHAQDLGIWLDHVAASAARLRARIEALQTRPCRDGDAVGHRR